MPRPHSVGEPVPSRIPSKNPHHEQWALTAEERAWYRERALQAQAVKKAAASGQGPAPLHDINVPALDPESLYSELPSSGIRALSLFSGGGGLDLGFQRAGFDHVASWELLGDAALTLQKANPDWTVFGGEEQGDVTKVDWSTWKGKADVVHGGPPCQPFSSAGRQKGSKDIRDCFPIFVEAVLAMAPAAFLAENVPALGTAKFAPYLESVVLDPLRTKYHLHVMERRVEHFGVPQTRRRLMIVGFANARDAARFEAPAGDYGWWPADQQPLTTCLRTMGVRQALGLPDLGHQDALAPTIRSSLTGPRHTTSIVSSAAAHREWDRLGIWPNGVAPDRERARAFPTPNGNFRLSLQDVALIQGFPEWWPFQGAAYMVLGQVGNAVPPPLAYAVACSIRSALSAR